MIKLANAPVSWGVDYADDQQNPDWQTVMGEIASAGYRFTELGPYGYYPTDPERLREEFGARELTPVAGFLFQKLHDPAEEQNVLAIAEKTAKLLGLIGAQHLVVIDHISEERMRWAGNRARARPLDTGTHRYMVSLIGALSEIAQSNGIQPVLHQHAGCYIEYEDEVERLLADIPADQAGICIDTGHMAYAGIDPVRFFNTHHARVRYFHFKDIDRTVHAQVLREGIPFLEAVQNKIFCPIGKGVVDWPALAEATRTHGYDGAATIEQDIDPTISRAPLEDARDSLEYLKSLGF